MTEKLTINEFCPETMPMSCTWVIIGAPGTGKCMGLGSKILMANGKIEPVENIKVGDLLMGDDSTPRRVLKLYHGRDQLYRVSPRDGSESYRITGNHVLCLKYCSRPSTSIDVFSNEPYRVNYAVSEYDTETQLSKVYAQSVSFATLDEAHKRMSYCATHQDLIYEVEALNIHCIPSDVKRHLRGYRTPIHFPSQLVEINPYLVGRYVGEEMVLKDQGYRIPEEYKFNDQNIRFQVLAGIIDAVGRVIEETSYEIMTRDRDVYLDIKYVARSLGLYVGLITNDSEDNKNTVYRIMIRGSNVEHIPTQKVRVSKIDRSNDYELTYKFDIYYDGIDDYYGFELDGNHRYVLGDFTVTHNSTLMENFAYYLKHRYPVARVFSGTEAGYIKFCKIFGPLYVSNYFKEDDETRYITRQRNRVMEYGEAGDIGNHSINIIDDVCDDPRIFRTPLMRSIFKHGSQHWDHLVMIGNQYAIDFPPDIRKCISYVALGRETEPVELKKLYDNFGGLCGSFERFCSYMKQITGDHTFLIIQKRSQSNDAEDCIFWYQTKPMKDWTFGCKEYRQWNKDRYDPNYIEKVVM